jgi:hypothetical protein
MTPMHRRQRLYPPPPSAVAQHDNHSRRANNHLSSSLAFSLAAIYPHTPKQYCNHAFFNSLATWIGVHSPYCLACVWLFLCRPDHCDSLYLSQSIRTFYPVTPGQRASSGGPSFSPGSSARVVSLCSYTHARWESRRVTLCVMRYQRHGLISFSIAWKTRSGLVRLWSFISLPLHERTTDNGSLSLIRNSISLLRCRSAVSSVRLGFSTNQLTTCLSDSN